MPDSYKALLKVGLLLTNPLALLVMSCSKRLTQKTAMYLLSGCFVFPFISDKYFLLFYLTGNLAQFKMGTFRQDSSTITII